METLTDVLVALCLEDPMERPPLTVVLTSVLSAAVENPNRPALLATLRPQLGAPLQAQFGTNEGRPDTANVIPLPRRSVESVEPADPEPTPAA
jgi:hypothetical protein